MTGEGALSLVCCMDIKQVVRDFWNAFNRGEVEEALALASEDVVFTVTGTTPVSDSYRGKDSVRGHFSRFGGLVDSDAEMIVGELIAEEDVVVCLSCGTMRATNTGARYDNGYVFVFRFKDERIAHITEYLDTALVETALFGRSFR